jgi:chromosome segregation ATPase
MEKEQTNTEKQVANIEEASLTADQLAEQLYNNAGLDAVIKAGLKDYDETLHREDKLITKVLGPRGNDIQGYGQAVAKRVAVAVFELLNRQYGGRMGNLRAYIAKLEDDRDRANSKYDELMGRVVGILGDEYRELRTDSNKFMEKLTTLMGEDIEAKKIDQTALAERLADIDGLRAEIKKLETEKSDQAKDYENRLAALNKEWEAEKTAFEQRIASLEKDLTDVKASLKELESRHRKLKDAADNLDKAVDEEDIGRKLSDSLYEYLLADSQIPPMVLSGVGKFIDFKKYLSAAAAKGAAESKSKAGVTLQDAMK